MDCFCIQSYLRLLFGTCCYAQKLFSFTHNQPASLGSIGRCLRSKAYIHMGLSILRYYFHRDPVHRERNRIRHSPGAAGSGCRCNGPNRIGNLGCYFSRIQSERCSFWLLRSRCSVRRYYWEHICQYSSCTYYDLVLTRSRAALSLNTSAGNGSSGS